MLLSSGNPFRKPHQVLGKAKENLERADNGQVDALVVVCGETVDDQR